MQTETMGAKQTVKCALQGAGIKAERLESYPASGWSLTILSLK